MSQLRLEWQDTLSSIAPQELSNYERAATHAPNIVPCAQRKLQHIDRWKVPLQWFGLAASKHSKSMPFRVIVKMRIDSNPGLRAVNPMLKCNLRYLHD